MIDSPLKVVVCTNLALSSAMMIYTFMSRPLAIVLLVATAFALELALAQEGE